MIGYERILAELNRRVAAQPELAGTVAYWATLLSIQSRAEPKHCACETLRRQASARLRAGQPILATTEFAADRIVLATLCHRICMITATHLPNCAPALDDMRAWFSAEHDSLLTLAACFLDEGQVRRGEEVGLAGPLLAFVFNQALHPFLRQYARLLAPCVDESMWYRRFCPICGGTPDFAALERGNGARRLLCSRCDFEWTFWRITCPFCGCDDPDKQNYSIITDQAHLHCRCDQCGRALPMIDLRQSEDERLPVVERNLMLIRQIAQEAECASLFVKEKE